MAEQVHWRHLNVSCIMASVPMKYFADSLWSAQASKNSNLSHSNTTVPNSNLMHMCIV